MDGDSSAKHEVLNFQEGFCRFWLKYESDIFGECCVRRKGGQAFSPYYDQCFPIFIMNTEMTDYADSNFSSLSR